MKINCFVLENIYTLPMEGFLTWTPTPSGNSSNKIEVFKIFATLPIKISVTRHGVKIDISLNDSRLKWNQVKKDELESQMFL